ncbi:MAG: hydrogenase maturation protease [Candidatus Methanodesulfokora sp.]|nr:MAG: hydrogenase 3 maturation endopeptidase HyCI [Candidatus Korarchaeota archaeon]
MSEDLKDRIKRALKGKYMVVCIGNELRGDDGVGIYIGRRLKNAITTEFPEDCIHRIRDEKPDTILFIDAVDFGGEPGSVIFSELREAPSAISTHRLPLSLLIELLEEVKPKAYILGIQPKSMNLGEGLSSEVRKSADMLLSILRLLM